MANTGCVCNGAPLNSGTSGCIEQIKTWDYIVRVDTLTAAGLNNTIPKGDVINDTYVKAKLNHIDPTVKWTIFPKLWAIVDERADPLTETIDNTDFIEGDGTRNFLGFHIGKEASPQMNATWNSAKCRTSSVFGLTSGGQIEGINPDISVGDLYPIDIQNDTLLARYMKPTKAPTKQKVEVRFAVDETVSDDQLDFIASANITYATTNWYSDAPIDIVGTHISNATGATTVIVIDLNERFGSVDKNNITDLVIGDFSWDNGSTTSAVFNDSTSLSVTLTTVVESVTIPGQYTLTMPLQTVTDIIRIDIFKEGFDMRDPLLVTLV